jgi:NADPH:quinone reductase-like Zn-dependent oxidoreductase
MLAARIHEYGGPEVLRVEEVDKPAPGPRDVLIRVRASAVNPVDWKVRSGVQRNIMRYKLPWILGLDVSGVVEAKGAEVTRFQVGDEVWSSPTHRRPGTYADYVCIDEREVAKKPKNLTHEEAASIPLVGLTAYQCLVEACRLKKGDRVLIHAGAGGVGSFAIQLARHLGAHVLTTASARNADFVRELGADEVIDYTKGSFADGLVDAPVDAVLDSLGESAFDDNLRALRRGGRMANITFDVGKHIERSGTFFSLLTLGVAFLRLLLLPWFRKGVRSRHVIKRCDGEQLGEITRLVEAGAIKPIIDRVVPLAEIQEAHRHSESHHARGKIVVKVSEG